MPLQKDFFTNSGVTFRGQSVMPVPRYAPYDAGNSDGYSSGLSGVAHLLSLENWESCFLKVHF